MPQLTEHQKDRVQVLLDNDKRQEAVRLVQNLTEADPETCRRLVTRMALATPAPGYKAEARARSRALAKAAAKPAVKRTRSSADDSWGTILLNWLAMLGFAFGLIAFFVGAILLLIRLRGSATTLDSSDPPAPYAVSIPVTLAGIAFFIFVGPRLLRRLSELGPRTGGVPDWIRAIGALPMLFLIPILVTGGPKRPSATHLHATSSPEILVIFLGLLASVPPILAALCDRWWAVAVTVVIWLGWAVAIYNAQYGWSAVAAGVQVVAAVALALTAKRPPTGD